MAETAGLTPATPPNSGGVPSGWNQKNPAVRRIMADIRELARDPSDQYAAKPCDENMFEWHFVIRGPKGTDFEGGRYHGKILLPAEYPFKPPNIVFLTPNGRWEIKTKICLSMSAYHPEDWQPAWGIRTMLEALISFMPSPSDGALGALDSTPEQRKRFASESLNYTHPSMPILPDEGSCSSNRSKDFAEAISQMKLTAAKEPAVSPEASTTTSPAPLQTPENAQRPAVEPVTPVHAPNLNQQQADIPQEVRHQENAPVQLGTAVAQAISDEDVAPDVVDDALKGLSWLVLVTIFVLVYRKLLLAYAPEL